MDSMAFPTTPGATFSQQIRPKGISIVVTAPTPATPDFHTRQLQQKGSSPPPTIPTASVKDAKKTGIVIRACTAGRLLRGAGHVKPNDAICCSILQRSSTAAAVAVTVKTDDDALVPLMTEAPPSPTTLISTAMPIHHGTVIAPWYCSVEDRLVDFLSSAAIAINQNPDVDEVDRGRNTLLPPVPHNSFTETKSESPFSTVSRSYVESESGVRVTSGDSSTMATASASAQVEQKATRRLTKTFDDLPYPVAASYARLAYVYDLPPPPPPLFHSTTASSTASRESSLSTLSGNLVDYEEERRRNDEYYRERPEDYTSGVMMAAKHIKEAIERPKKKKRQSWMTVSSVFSTAHVLNATSQAGRRVIPGWTDGSDRWRASVYSLSAPNRKWLTLEEEEDYFRALYSNKGFVSTPLRSKAVNSPSSKSPRSSAPASGSNTGVASRDCREAEELYSKFDMSFAKRVNARMSRSHQSSHIQAPHHHHHHAIPISVPLVRKREMPILRKGSEGKLLVPDMKLKRIDPCASFAAGTTSVVCEEYEERIDGCAKCQLTPSMLHHDSRLSADTKVHAESVSVAGSRRKRPSQKDPVHWTYRSNQLLYPILDIPQTKKQIVKEMGLEHEIEIEIVVPHERKRLFTFPSATAKA